MTSIPQLRKDINDLQAEIRRLKEELEIERNKDHVVSVVYRDVPGPVRYRDNPKHIEMIRKLQGRK